MWEESRESSKLLVQDLSQLENITADVTISQLPIPLWGLLWEYKWDGGVA